MRPKVQVSGGDRIAQKLRSLRQRASSSNVRIGVPEDAGTYDDGTSVAAVAAYNEFGAGDTPERSFLRVPLRSNQGTWLPVFKDGLKRVVSGEISSYQMLSVTGDTAARIAQQAILEQIPPPNAPSTLAQKDRKTPLIDTERLINSITYVVDGEAEQ